jgi:hypothetical protein
MVKVATRPPVASGKEQEARQRLEAYIAPVYADPLKDTRKLSIRGACEAIGMSVNTVYKYGLDKRLEEAKEHRAGERERERERERVKVGTGSAKDQALARLRAERDEWKSKYEALLEAHINLQHALRLEPGVNMERVLKRHLPKAVRNAPGRAVGRQRRK